MRNHKICKKAILKFNISWRHNINDFLMYNVLFVQKSSVHNASLTNFRAKKIRELATKKIFYFLFFFLSICPTYGENLKRIWDYSNSICCLIKNCSLAFVFNLIDKVTCRLPPRLCWSMVVVSHTIPLCRRGLVVDYTVTGFWLYDEA